MTALGPDCVKTPTRDMRYAYCMRGALMKRFVQAEDRAQGTLLPERLDNYVGADNPVAAMQG